MSTTDSLLYRELDVYIDSLHEKDGKLIPVLHKAQDIFGYLPMEVQRHVAKAMDIPASKVYGVVTFYSFFTMVKKGRNKIAICMGTACFVKGAKDILDEFKAELGIDAGQVTKDGMFSLDALRCIGACGLAPVLTVNGKYYGRAAKDDVRKIIKEYGGGV